ncbi:MAG: site-2 protease family protein, partial [Patescibacteria group bacterium]
MLITILVFLIILSVLVLIHELGHFLVAKKLGIKVEEFGFGLPPRAFGIKKGETIYSINWLPIGGFVKLYGEDEAGGGKVSSNHQINRAFFARPVWQRLLVVIAGVAMNFLLSIAIISYIFGVSGVRTQGDKVIVTEVVRGAPAEEAGIRKGDIIEAVNGIEITSTIELISITKEHLGEEVILKIKDQSPLKSGTKIKNIKVTPRKNYPKNQGPMGVAVSQNIITKKYPWYEAPIVGTKESLKASGLIIASLG